MFWRLVLLFTIVPIVEIYLLLGLGSLLGFWPTLGIVVGTALLGSFLSKREGLRVWREYQQALAQMRMPEEGILSGLLVLVGAVLLVTPGVLTDLAGLLLMVPQVRRAAAGWLEKRLRASFDAGTREAVVVETVLTPRGALRRRVHVRTASSRPPPTGPGAAAAGEVVEGGVVEGGDAGGVVEGGVVEGDVLDARGRLLRPAGPS